MQTLNWQKYVHHIIDSVLNRYGLQINKKSAVHKKT